MKRAGVRESAPAALKDLGRAIGMRASQRVDQRIRHLGDWRGETVARMGFPRSRLLLCLLTMVALPASGQDLIAVAKRVPAISLDSTLPAVPFERWLAGLRRTAPSGIAWEINDCGEGGDGRLAPTCVEAIIRLGADSTARVSLIMTGINGKGVASRIWDLSVGAGQSFAGFKTLQSWAAYVSTLRTEPR